MGIFASSVTAATPEAVQESLSPEITVDQTSQTGGEQTDQTAVKPDSSGSDEGAEQKDEPVDGKNEDMAIDKLDTDVNLPKGEFTAAAEQSAPRSHNQFQMTLALFDRAGQHGRRVDALRTSLGQAAMIDAYTAVAQEHNLSAPLVAAFEATPGFAAAVENFPSASLFNSFAEHPKAERNVLGLESLASAEAKSADVIRAKTEGVVESFSNLLNGLGGTVDNLQVQLRETKAAFEASDITDEVLETLPVHTLSNIAFTTSLTKLEAGLKTLDLFKTDELRANPENIKQEVEGLESMVTELGDVAGFKLDQHGLRDTDRNIAFESSDGNFADKSIDKAAMEMYFSKAEGVLEGLKAIHDSKDDIVASLNTAVAEMPTASASDDVTYGYVDHTTLLSSYTTLATKMVSESVAMVSTVLTAADAALDVKSGLEG